MSRESFETQGQQIKKALIDLDLSYMDLARAMGVSVYYVREIIAGTRKAEAMRSKIARYLGNRYRRMGVYVPKWLEGAAPARQARRKEMVA